MRGNIVRYTVTGVDGKVRHTVDIRLRAQTMMHDFSLTEKYVVLYDLPVALDLGKRRGLSAGSRARHAAPDFVLRKVMRASERTSSPGSGMPYRWAPERQARIGVMPRDGSADDIRWFEVAPCYVFHPLNSYDVASPDGDSIVLDVVRHESVFTNGDSLFPETRSLDRWTVDLTAGKVTEERIDDTIQEFPRVDERLVGRPHRYGYAVGYSPAATGTADAILKHDLTTRRTQSRRSDRITNLVNSSSYPPAMTLPRTTAWRWASSTIVH